MSPHKLAKENNFNKYRGTKGDKLEEYLKQLKFKSHDHANNSCGP